MTEPLDPEFYERADAFIRLANTQGGEADRGQISASFLYSVSRYNAWVSACSLDDAADMRRTKDEIIEYFVAQYRAMLSDNVDDYVENFDQYMKKDR